MIFGRKVQVGLDIGSYSLQWAAIDLRSKKSEVWRAPALARDSDINSQASRDNVRSLLAKCEKESSLWNRTVVLGMQGVGVVSGYLELPSLKDSELEMAVFSSVSREIPFPINTMEVVHLPVAPLGSGKSAVFYSVWPKEESKRLSNICEACDLKIRRIEATGIALTRELFRNRKLDSEKFYCIANMGHEMTQVVVVKAGYPYYLRDIPVGGKAMTKAVALRSRAPWSEAEKMKEQSPLFELFPSIGAVLSELSYELSRTLKYFKRRFRVDAIDTVFLSGGSSLLQDLPEWLEGEIDHPIVLETWEDTKPRELAGEAQLNKVALGLAWG